MAACALLRLAPAAWAWRHRGDAHSHTCLSWRPFQFKQRLQAEIYYSYLMMGMSDLPVCEDLFQTVRDPSPNPNLRFCSST